MLPTTVIGVLVCVATFSTLVVADPGSVLIGNSIDISQIPNEYFGTWTFQMEKGKKNSLFTVIIPTKKELPDTMRFKFNVVLNGEPPMGYEISLCEALNDAIIGKSAVKAGLPKDQFPKRCPIPAGDWTIMKWDPPAAMIPPGTPDGPVTASVEVGEEGKEAYVTLSFKGEVSHAIPGLGR